MDYSKLIIEAKLGRWEDITSILNNSTNEEAYELIKFIAYSLDPSKDYKKVLESKNINSILCGGILYFLAIKARKGLTPDLMSDKQIDLYESLLIGSYEIFESKLSLNSSSGLVAAFYAGLSINEIYEGMKSDADNIVRNAQNVPISGYINLLSSKSQKWGGSHAEMFAIANEFFDEKRPGTAALIARAHFEKVLYMEAFEENPNQDKLTNDYISQISEELFDASNIVLNSKINNAELRFANGEFALTLGCLDLFRQASKHLSVLRNFHDPYIWSTLQNAKLFKIYWKFMGVLN